MHYFIIDFLAQTDLGLKSDIKSSGVANIDPWEDMKEDANNIENYLFVNFKFEVKNKAYLKIKTKYIIRYIIMCSQSLNLFIKENKEIINQSVKNGWAPYSYRGIPFQISEIEENDVSNFSNQALRLNELINSGLKILSFGAKY